jgi:hypothetical protein
MEGYLTEQRSFSARFNSSLIVWVSAGTLTPLVIARIVLNRHTNFGTRQMLSPQSGLHYCTWKSPMIGF